ncbi:DUF3558 family protein [Nocardia sp. NPDC127606]|uniref:DUF3558 family protein n=1 Tax=Nocardia sp. NPDC127606 TaxID=3345406 RepID=UPI00363DA9A1
MRPTRIGRSIAPIILLFCSAGCTISDDPVVRSSTTPPMQLSTADLPYDPCDRLPPELLTAEGLRIQMAKRSNPATPTDPGVRYSGCLIGGPPSSAAFYLQTTNTTVDHFRQSKISGNYNFTDRTIDNRTSTIANNKQFPGTCKILVQVDQYSVLLDGRFSDETCENGVNLAEKFLVALEG